MCELKRVTWQTSKTSELSWTQRQQRDQTRDICDSRSENSTKKIKSTSQLDTAAFKAALVVATENRMQIADNNCSELPEETA
jgi:hypothetical protein